MSATVSVNWLLACLFLISFVSLWLFQPHLAATVFRKCENNEMDSLSVKVCSAVLQGHLEKLPFFSVSVLVSKTSSSSEVGVSV